MEGVGVLARAPFLDSVLGQASVEAEDSKSVRLDLSGWFDPRASLRIHIVLTDDFVVVRRCSIDSWGLNASIQNCDHYKQRVSARYDDGELVKD